MSTFNKIKHIKDNQEFWYARELMPLLGYKRWEDFHKLIVKVLITDFEDKNDHIRYTPKKVKLGSGAVRKTTDYILSRLSCYKIAMLGNTPECVQARTYFAIQTRKQEIHEETLRHEERLQLREKSKQSYKSYNKTLVNHNVAENQIGIVTSLGDKALFGKKTKEIKEDHNIPKNEPLEDYTHSLNTTARMFGRELTKEKVKKVKSNSLKEAISIHSRNNKKVRELMINEDIKPENLPMQEDLKKVKIDVKKLSTSEEEFKSKITKAALGNS